nr:hypothetical protein BaRGS_027110 [Batillaria attramentaria]
MDSLPTIIYLGIIMVVGIVGNSIVFLVYYRRFKPSATRTFVLAMSAFDLTTNIVSLPGEFYCIRYSYMFNNAGMCKWLRFNNSFLALLSGLVLVDVALDRYRKICRPLHKQYSLRRTTVSIVVCAGVSVALTIPFTVLNGRQTVDTGVGNITGFMCSIDDAYVHSSFLMIYNLLMMVAFLTCVTMMIVCYARIACELSRHRKKSNLTESGTGHSEGHHRLWRKRSDTTSDVKEDSATSELHPSSSSGEAGSQPPHAAQGIPDKTVTATRKVCETVSSSDGMVLHSVTFESIPKNLEHHSSPLATEAHTDVHDPNMPARNLTDQTTSPCLHSVLSRDREKERKKGKGVCVSSSTKPTRKSRGSVKKIPTSTTFMMFVLTVVFIINYLPHLIIITLRAVLKDVDKGLTGVRLNAYHIALRSYFINCAINSIVYGFCNARFRQECRRFFSRTVK